MLNDLGRKLRVTTPEFITLYIRTLEFVHLNGTMGNLRDYEVPPRQKNYKSPPKPTPAPGQKSHGVFVPVPWFLMVSLVGWVFSLGIEGFMDPR